jgi:hypothetical protein
MKEEETLSNIDYTFKILERDRDKHAKILTQRKLREDGFRRLKTVDNRIKKDYRKLVITDQ